MNSTCSRFHKLKGRPTKRKKALAANLNRRWAERSSASPTNSAAESNSEPKSEDCTVPEILKEGVESSYLMMSQQVWSTLLNNIPCSECSKNSLALSQHQSYGFAQKIELVCKNCEHMHGSVFASERVGSTDKTFEINNKMVEAFLAIGKGHAALETFAMVLGTPSMDRKTFAKCLQNLHSQTEKVRHRMMELSRESIRQAHITAEPTLAEHEIINIKVSYDGSWQKRGFTSNLGIFCVIDFLTGLVVDFEVLSKYCQECTIAARDLNADSPEFNIWKEGHASECQHNYSGSSGGMEVAAATIMWKRSETLCKMRYTTMLSDGDSKTFLHLIKEKVYGEGTTIEKEECINHVAKRLGTALRKKIQEWKAKKVTLGGRKRGHLKDEVVKRLQNYYRNALKNNAPDVPKMKTAVLASLTHCMSTDDKPQHSKCPEGPTSWCFYQKALALGKKPGSHKNMKTPLTEEVVEKILPVYQRLACDQLLQRCTSAKTQNLNESLHSSIWRKCPKEVFVSKKRLEIAATNAIKEYNLGYVKSHYLTNEGPADNSFNIAIKKESRRTTQRQRKSTKAYKQERNAKKYKNKTKNVSVEKKEGHLYGDGDGLYCLQANEDPVDNSYNIATKKKSPKTTQRKRKCSKASKQERNAKKNKNNY